MKQKLMCQIIENCKPLVRVETLSPIGDHDLDFCPRDFMLRVLKPSIQTKLPVGTKLSITVEVKG